ncbi:MAG: MFS transporter [Chloroflexi bacterium]|nr:MAG: MFS transporter [Chloroflexota bacterium]
MNLSKISAVFSAWQSRAEMWLIGPLDSDVRHNMHIDLSAALTASMLSTIITFIPIILRRSGASTQQVAYYFAITTLGLLTSNISLRLMRRWGMKRVAIVCWLVGRGCFLLTAWAFNATSLLVIFTIFWVLEAWPSPAYVQLIQAIYPIEQRGRILAAVRVGFVALILTLTPLAGWLLDHWGYRALLPLAGVSGIVATLIFYKLMNKVPDTLVESSRHAMSARQILQTDKRMLFYLGANFLFGLGALMASPLYAIIQVDQLNLSYTVIGLFGFVQSFFWFLGYLFGGRLLDRIGGLRSLQIVFALNALVMLPYIWATQGWMLLPSFIAAGLVTAGADLAILYTVSSLAGPERVPDYAALNATVSGLRGLLGPFIGSVLVSNGWHYWAVFALSASLTLAGAAALAFITKPQATVLETQ